VIVASIGAVCAHPVSVKVAWTVPLGRVVALDVIVAFPAGHDVENVTVTGFAGAAPLESTTDTAIDAVPYAERPLAPTETVSADIFRLPVPLSPTLKFVEAFAV